MQRIVPESSPSRSRISGVTDAVGSRQRFVIALLQQLRQHHRRQLVCLVAGRNADNRRTLLQPFGLQIRNLKGAIFTSRRFQECHLPAP